MIKMGKRKKVTVKASENTKEFAAQFNGMAFEYGDIVKIYQKNLIVLKCIKRMNSLMRSMVLTKCSLK